MVGHLFGYEAALAIDASARPLREAREAIEQAVADGPNGDAGGRPRCGPRSRRTRSASSTALRDHVYDGHLEASTAVRLVGLLRDLMSPNPVEQYAASSGKVGTPAALDRRARRSP